MISVKTVKEILHQIVRRSFPLGQLPRLLFGIEVLVHTVMCVVGPLLSFFPVFDLRQQRVEQLVVLGAGGSLDEFRAAMQQERRRGFDLPLLKVKTTEIGAQQLLILLIPHTFINDLSSGFSSPVTVRKVASENRSDSSSYVGMNAAHGL